MITLKLSTELTSENKELAKLTTENAIKHEEIGKIKQLLNRTAI
jgi:hypothetical protein